MSKHVLVIGAGVTGLCTSYYALQRGHRVTVLERGGPEHEGTSYGNAGLVVPSHFIPLAAPGMVKLALKWMWHPESPFYVRPRLSGELLSWGWRFWRAATPERVRQAAPLLRDLHLASRACYDELGSRHRNPFGLERRGLLMLCKTTHALEEEGKAARMAAELGLPARVLTASEACELEPGLRMDVAGAVYYAEDAHLSPGRFMRWLRERLERDGARFHWNTSVTGWRVRGRRIEAVQTSRGEFSADEYVLCAGAWSGGLARQLGLKLPLQAGKGYSLTLARPRGRPGIPAILVEARVAVTPMEGALRFAGTMEIAEPQEGVNPRRVRGIIKSVSQYYPEFKPEDFEGVPAWFGLRPCSPDGLPYIGRFARYDNLSTATGHAMMGLSLGPITGRLMAEILSDERPSLAIEVLNPDRYA